MTLPAPLRLFPRFVWDCARLVVRGDRYYHLWLAFLGALVAVGAVAYSGQLRTGLIATNMRDLVSWGFYIGNFTFLVGVAAAAVVLVIPAYVYNWKPIKEIALIGELLAVSALVMCMLFVSVDIGRPERFWHLMMPGIGRLNVPKAMLAWDVIVLTVYLTVNAVLATHLIYRGYTGRPYSKRFALPLILFSIPAAVSIHTVTAFIYNGMVARPYWNSAILAPRFLASAFCSGPAIILVVLQIIRRNTKLEIKDEALWKIAELMAYAMFINLFLFGAEIFREYYSGAVHLAYTKYLFTGLHGHTGIVVYGWTSVVCSILAFFLFLIPKTRKNLVTLNIGAGLIYIGVYIEKGVALVVPGFTPSGLGEIYEYTPSWTEIAVSSGIFAIGSLVFTFSLKVAIPIMTGALRFDRFPSAEPVLQPSPAKPSA